MPGKSYRYMAKSTPRSCALEVLVLTTPSALLLLHELLLSLVKFVVATYYEWHSIACFFLFQVPKELRQGLFSQAALATCTEK